MNASVRAQLPWLPPDGTTWHVEGGTHFDAVRVGRGLGLTALEELGDDSGAVICDPWTRIHCFLTEPSSTITWEVQETVPCGPAIYVVVPPLNARETVLHWAVQPSPERPWTAADQLRQVLRAAVDARFKLRWEHLG